MLKRPSITGGKIALANQRKRSCQLLESKQRECNCMDLYHNKKMLGGQRQRGGNDDDEDDDDDNTDDRGNSIVRAASDRHNSSTTRCNGASRSRGVNWQEAST